MQTETGIVRHGGGIVQKSIAPWIWIGDIKFDWPKPLLERIREAGTSHD